LLRHFLQNPDPQFQPTSVQVRSGWVNPDADDSAAVAQVQAHATVGDTDEGADALGVSGLHQ